MDGYVVEMMYDGEKRVTERVKIAPNLDTIQVKLRYVSPKFKGIMVIPLSSNGRKRYVS